MPETQGVTPAAQIPSAQEMEAVVAQVPQTETAPPLDQQTQQASQPQVTPEQQAMSNGIALANTPEIETTDDMIEKTLIVADGMVKIKKWAVKSIGIALTIQGIHGLYKSVIFILVDYPLLEQQLVAHQITQDQVNDFGIKAIMMVISTVLSMFFAMKLTFLKSKAAKTLSTVIAILLFIGNAMIHDYFISLNSSQYLVDLILKAIYLVQGAPKEVIDNTPFLEETIEGTIDTVWYK
ncbi:MAG: hypothetical protein GW941_02350 [Candidatus Pacebacteria bacterium]|nr:hypothetical protein [Candidatus Paceibacterota bacterium]